MPELHFIDSDGELLDVVPYCCEDCLNMDLADTNSRDIAYGNRVPDHPPLDGVLDPRNVFLGYFDDEPEQVNYLINWMRGTDCPDAKCHRCLESVPLEVREMPVPLVPPAARTYPVFGYQVVEKPAKTFAGERLRRLEFEDEVIKPDPVEEVRIQAVYGRSNHYEVLLALDLKDICAVVAAFDNMFGGPVPEKGIIAGGLYDRIMKAKQALEETIKGG